jgi:FkbM family methyltransferase
LFANSAEAKCELASQPEAASETQMNERLIFDIGMHRCEDTDYYLWRGYNVVAVDADPSLIEHARQSHSDAIAAGQLRLVNSAIGADQGSVKFYRSKRTVWSSLKDGIAGRDRNDTEVIEVPMRRLSDLFSEFGVPYYCKIDIEGYDAIALRSINPARELPHYISTETECLSEGEQISEERSLETLDALRGLGYQKFKLVDQRSLLVLAPERATYRMHPTVTERLFKRLGIRRYEYWGFDGAEREHPKKVDQRVGYGLARGGTGPFGGDLAGKWTDYKAARAGLLRHRRDFFQLRGTKNYDFWCDWHATK